MTDFKMPDYNTLVIAAAAVYAVFALLVPVRKKKQSAAAWLPAIIIQFGTVWHFGVIESLAEEYVPMLAELAGITLPREYPVARIAAIAVCVIFNILVILILNALAIAGAKRKYRKTHAQAEPRPKQDDGDSRQLEQLQREIAAAAISINSADRRQ